MALLNDTLEPHRITRVEREYNTKSKRYPNGTLTVKKMRSTPVVMLRLEWDGISLSEYNLLEAFFDARSGGFESFTVRDNHTNTVYTVRFADDKIERRNSRPNMRGLYRVRLNVETA